MIDKIKAAIEEIRPFLKADGGDIELVEVTEDGTVKVRLTGACGTCPMSTMTLRMGVEKKIRETVPEVKEVIPVD
jgi:Fe-S cluster biogenesis protein NfuA